MDHQKQVAPATIIALLKGLGQIMLQNSFWTGLFFIAGIFCGSVIMGIAAIVSVLTGTLTAKLLKYNADEIDSGLYGFSAALVGVALVCFFQPTIIIWLGILLGSALATIIQHLFITKKIPAFTFPFILVTWVFLAITYYFPTLIQAQTGSNSTYTNGYIQLFPRGFGQVIFQDNIWAGILFMIGIFIGRPIAAVYAIVSIALSSCIAHWLKEPVNDIYLGLLSYNAVLCAITFAGKKGEDFIMALISVALSVLIMIQMRQMHMPALTFPFVLATWVVLVVKMVKQAVQLKFTR